MDWLSVIVLVHALCYATAIPAGGRISPNESPLTVVDELLSLFDEESGQETEKSSIVSRNGGKTIKGCPRRRASRYEEKVVEGTPAPAGYNKWFVKIRNSEGFVCGGSLISPRLVLTAAHCFYTAENQNVVKEDDCKSVASGGYKAILKEHDDDSETIAITHVYKNSNFAKNQAYDSVYSEDEAIAVLSENIRAAFTPGFCLKRGWPDPRDKCYAVGVGPIVFEQRNANTQMQHVHRGTVTLLDCHSFITKLRKDFDDALCTSEGGAKGDSGGPVLCYPWGDSEETPYLMGLISQFHHTESVSTVHNAMRNAERWIEDFLDSPDPGKLESCVTWRKKFFW